MNMEPALSLPLIEQNVNPKVSADGKTFTIIYQSQLCCSVLLLPSFFPRIMVFSSESAVHIKWPKYQRFSFSISYFNEYSGLISFKIDWFDLFALQGTLKSLLQHRSLKVSILWHSAFFMVQLSQTYMTTRRTRALTIWAFECKVMSLLFNMLSRLVIDFMTNRWGNSGHSR